MSYIQGVYGPGRNGVAAQAPVSNVAGPSSIGINTSVQGTAAGIAGPIALIVLLGGLVGLYVLTRRVQGSVGR